MATITASLSGSRIMQMPGKVKLNVVGYIFDTVVDLTEAKDRISAVLKMETCISIGIVKADQIRDTVLRSYCHSIQVELGNIDNASKLDITSFQKQQTSFLAFQCELDITVVVLHDGPVIEDEDETSSDDDNSNSSFCQTWPLPNRDFAGLVSTHT